MIWPAAWPHGCGWLARFLYDSPSSAPCHAGKLECGRQPLMVWGGWRSAPGAGCYSRRAVAWADMRRRRRRWPPGCVPRQELVSLQEMVCCRSAPAGLGRNRNKCMLPGPTLAVGCRMLACGHTPALRQAGHAGPSSALMAPPVRKNTNRKCFSKQLQLWIKPLQSPGLRCSPQQAARTGDKRGGGAGSRAGSPPGRAMLQRC